MKNLPPIALLNTCPAIAPPTNNPIVVNKAFLKFSIELFIFSSLIGFKFFPPNLDAISDPTLVIVLIALIATVAAIVNGIATVFINLPIFNSAGNDLIIVNPRLTRIAFKIPPRKPPNPFPLLLDFKLTE